MPLEVNDKAADSSVSEGFTAPRGHVGGSRHFDPNGTIPLHLTFFMQNFPLSR
ncbi:Uncharacterised protein [Yersinia bercovieri]|nr:Uncharacterised protein [Yersinia bercovieri]